MAGIDADKLERSLSAPEVVKGDQGMVKQRSVSRDDQGRSIPSPEHGLPTHDSSEFCRHRQRRPQERKRVTWAYWSSGNLLHAAQVVEVEASSTLDNLQREDHDTYWAKASGGRCRRNGKP